MASVPVSCSEEGVASQLVSYSKGGVAFLHDSPSKEGVTSVPVSYSEGGVCICIYIYIYKPLFIYRDIYNTSILTLLICTLFALRC